MNYRRHLKTRQSQWKIFCDNTMLWNVSLLRYTSKVVTVISAVCEKAADGEAARSFVKLWTSTGAAHASKATTGL